MNHEAREDVHQEVLLAALPRGAGLSRPSRLTLRPLERTLRHPTAAQAQPRVHYVPMYSRAPTLTLLLFFAAGGRLAAEAPSTGHQLLGTFVDSLKLLTIEHGIRISLQQKTGDELGGNPGATTGARCVSRGNGRTATAGGSTTSAIRFTAPPPATSGSSMRPNRDRRSRRRAATGRRARQATAWAAAYSYHFEFGPLSEASIGNVGLRTENTGW